VLWMRTEKPSLIKMTASYAHPEVTYHPTLDELRGQLEKFTRNILESTKQFGRWWDGFCKIFEERIHEETSEKYIPYTFYDDVMLNPVITHLHYEICQMRNQVVDKFSYFSRGWIKKLDFKKLFDKNELTKLQKMLFKNQQTFKIEESILSLKRYYQQIHEMPDMNYNFFVLINYQEVKSQAFEKVNEWLNVLGESLIDISQKELKNIVNDIGEYEKHLKTEVHGIDGLKHVLNIISEIKNTSMDMEFRINEIVEQFRVLKMYNYVVKPEVQQQVDILAQTWVDLIEMADRKDFELNEYKRNFSEVTKGDVLKFKKDLQEAYEKYLHHGPGSEGVTLEEGVSRLDESKELNE
jgi:dynein heavy chain